MILIKFYETTNREVDAQFRQSNVDKSRNCRQSSLARFLLFIYFHRVQLTAVSVDISSICELKKTLNIKSKVSVEFAAIDLST